MTRFAVALGSNQGDRVGHLRSAFKKIGDLGVIRAVSGLYETEPIGGPDQDLYLNAVILLETPLPPGKLLGELQRMETDHGRAREVRLGPRTLDLDIVASDGGPVDTLELTIPHPRAAERRFVLEPLTEIWPDAEVGPESSASSALGSVTDQEVDLLAANWADAATPLPGRYWALVQILWLGAIGAGLIYDGSLPGNGFDIFRVIGGLLIIVGGIAVLAAARSLGHALTILPEPVPGASLVVTGVYTLARHPMYGGVFLMMLGVSLLLASLAGALLSIGLLLFLWAKSGYEERQLRIAHPGYSAYRRRVRRRLIPYVL
ncbi:MAG: 2-amino-4-hydroxy-6-hydroxymethyldihydropteridine diphosphokinase [Acidimicrobiia bacterium]